ncbi:MAG: hypothetical protein V2G41_10165 [bacterium JZ-2024 1]
MRRLFVRWEGGGKKRSGIFLTMLGAVAGVWVFAHVTSFTGQLHTWPPYYETTALTERGVTVILLITGLIKLTKKASQPPA